MIRSSISKNTFSYIDKINISLFSDFYNGIVGLSIFRFDSFYQGFFSL
ncbi:hypothetical protein M125_5832 [Bacteroides fragilis str. 3998T(B)3]|uniref:Uncharacterized protein n=1 Tax=Bacteroides fragilis str. 3998T(B)3 TaxID=1339316 RepID=A0A015TYJ3_BACFG|nr:hypothetical protein M117_4973 [Bacteroides fragilis str. 3774 T13]EXY87547.1 hypothetical protein M125_5832 [Bacteroides fragilis str. 3998T(B)3]EXY98283.1 hypothetical protein M081_4748 [Bacteroides fragilis str. 3998 T(B) 4]